MIKSSEINLTLEQFELIWVVMIHVDKNSGRSRFCLEKNLDLPGLCGHRMFCTE